MNSPVLPLGMLFVAFSLSPSIPGLLTDASVNASNVRDLDGLINRGDLCCRYQGSIRICGPLRIVVVLQLELT